MLKLPRPFRSFSMLMRPGVYCGVPLLSILALSLRLDAAVIANGSFESPVVASNSFQSTTPDAWSTSGATFVVNGDGGDAIFPLPQMGDQYFDLGNFGTSLSQTFSIATDGDYLLSWYDNTAQTSVTTSPYTIAIEDSMANVVASQALDAYHAGLNDWQRRTLSLSLPAGVYTLTFSAAGTRGGLDTLVDNVSLDATTTAVPEPSTCTVLLIGMAGILLRRRRSAKAATELRTSQI